RAGPGGRRGRAHRDPGLDVQPQPGLGQPTHPADHVAAGDGPPRPGGPAPPALARELPAHGKPAAADHTEPQAARPAHADLLRRVRALDGYAAAELGRPRLASAA